jgi:hypothetical protein
MSKPNGRARESEGKRPPSRSNLTHGSGIYRSRQSPTLTNFEFFIQATDPIGTTRERL